MDIVETYLTRGSKRDFKDTPIPKELLTKIMELAMRVATTADTVQRPLGCAGGILRARRHEKTQEEQAG